MPFNKKIQWRFALKRSIEGTRSVARRDVGARRGRGRKVGNRSRGARRVDANGRHTTQSPNGWEDE